MKTGVRRVAGVALGLASLIPQPIWAQGTTPGESGAASPTLAPLPRPAPPPTLAPTPALAPAPAAGPAPAPAPPYEPSTQVAAERPDHERFVGRIGVTYFDIASLPIANPVAGGGPASITGSTVSAPVVGVRYWLQRNLGIDVGVGLGFAGGSREAIVGGVDTTVDKTSTTGVAIHGGLPIAFFHGRHYTFLVIPQMTLGFTSGTSTPTPGVQQDLSGFLFDAGGAIGAEIHFGFIGIPELALQASVGLSYRRSVFKWKSGGDSASDGTNVFGTNVSADPWALFKDAISATYYF
jgi:hypothetical protein